MANPIRTGLKNLHCVNTVFCGDQIEAVWANAVRDLGQSSFERGDTIFSLRCVNEGIIKIPIVGFCWNMLQNYDNDPERLVTWKYDTDPTRFASAYPYYHNILELYNGVNGNDPIAPNYGTPTINDGISGYQHVISDFENAGYTKAQIIARVRRGERYCDIPSLKILDPSSNITVYQFLNDSSYGSLMYRQHFQCWYMQENPSGSIFPPLKTLIFDDTDCPIQTETRILKEITLPITPIIGETTLDWIVLSVWYEVPFAGFLAGFPNPSYFVMNLNYYDYDAPLSDGLLSISCKLFKTC